MIRILHTADWHLGKRLADTDRTEDFRQFLDWLLELIEAQRIDVLLLSGDVFDTTMPATDAQRLYYRISIRAAVLGFLNNHPRLAITIRSAS